MRGPHLYNTVWRCVGSVKGLAMSAGATVQDVVGRVEAGGRWNGVAVTAICWRLMKARSPGSASHRSNSLRLARWPAGKQAISPRGCRLGRHAGRLRKARVSFGLFLIIRSRLYPLPPGFGVKEAYQREAIEYELFAHAGPLHGARAGDLGLRRTSL